MYQELLVQSTPYYSMLLVLNPRIYHGHNVLAHIAQIAFLQGQQMYQLKESKKILEDIISDIKQQQINEIMKQMINEIIQQQEN